MISIVSIADGILRDRAASARIVDHQIFLGKPLRSYPTGDYALVNLDSSQFAIGQVRWTGSAWADCTPAPTPPAPDPGPANYRAMMLRRARALDAAGDTPGAIALRLTLGA